MEPKDFEALHLSEKETREIITPYAFKVHKPLLGKPLAKPWERAFAIVVDIALIFLAAEVSGEFVWLIAAYGFYLSQRKGMSHRIEWLWRGPAKAIAIMIMLGAALVVVSDIIDYVSSAPNSASAVIEAQVDGAEVDPQEAVENLTSQAKELAANNSKQAPPTTSILDYATDLIEDLGLGFGWAAAYFSLFTYLWDGQTPGKRLINVSVVNLNGKPLTLMDTFGRYGGYGAGFATGLLGFLQVYWDPNRQAIQDKISNTVVVRGKARDLQLLVDAQSTVVATANATPAGQSQGVIVQDQSQQGKLNDDKHQQT